MKPDKRKFKLPLVGSDPEEVLRQMKRKPAEIDYFEGCPCCGSNHYEDECPCLLDKIPPGVEIDRIYDQVCIGCGRIGDICCSKGAYAVLKWCHNCFRLGHWYWENKCLKTWNPPSWMKVPSMQEVEDMIKNKVVNKDSFRFGFVDHVSDDEDDDRDEIDGYDCIPDCGTDGRKLKIPDRDQYKELLRLMKRGRKPYEIEDGCPICGDKTHWQHGCPCNQKIPPGVVIDDEYDEVCIGCGRIGQICCSKGAYAVFKECEACLSGGHWFWEGMCEEDFFRPPWLVEVLSMKEVPPTEQSLESSLQNKKEDEVMVNVGNDEKNEDEVMFEDDSDKKDEAKGGNASSKQISFEKMEEFLDSIPEGDSKNLINFTEHVMPSDIYDDEKPRDADQFPVTTQAGLSWSEVVNMDIVRSINKLST